MSRHNLGTRSFGSFFNAAVLVAISASHHKYDQKP